jgi:hypothetical protein
MTDTPDMFDEVAKMTREEFIEANPFGTVKMQTGTEEPREMTPEEYEDWVENSRGIWDD